MRTLRDLVSLSCIMLTLGSTKSVTLSIEEILIKKMNTMKSYFDSASDSEKSDSEEDE